MADQSLIDFSILGQFFQSLGVFAFALLFYMLNRAAPRRYFRYWVVAWFAMTLALIALQVAFRSRPGLDYMEFFYFFGEYVFSLFLFAGFASFPNRSLPRQFSWYWLIGLFAGWSLVLTFYNASFGVRFTMHAFVFSLSMLPSWWLLFRLPLPARHRWIKQFALVALGLLIGIFFLNGLSPTGIPGLEGRAAELYGAYQSIIDVLIEMLLAFSLLTIAAVNLQSRLEHANALLEAERDRMAMLAHKDALTDCFNRHALMQLESRLHGREGLIVMIDINDLKLINDTFGHQTGDDVIKQVAQVLQVCLRGQDYIFRYGGDEFLLVTFDFSLAAAEERMHQVEHKLKEIYPTDTHQFSVTISWGIQAFDDGDNFEHAMNEADKAMYKHKGLYQ